MTDGTARLGIDFGTSTTVAVLALPGREPRPLLFDGSPLLPSAVCVDATDRLIVGWDAIHTALSNPAAFEPHPKRCVDDGTVLLGSTELPVDRLFAAVLDRVYADATAVCASVTGRPPDEIMITCPASWGAERRATLLAAAPAGTRLVSEPVAAAHYFADVAGHRIADGGTALVYDLGAGTFDASVVRRTGSGFAVLASAGLADTGGLDIDAAIVAYLSTAVPDEEHWPRLQQPATAIDRRARKLLWDNVRAGKEMLSRSTSTMIHIPLLEVEVPLGREQLDELAAPILARTVATSRAVVEAAGVEAGGVGAAGVGAGGVGLSAILLAGGPSRMPAVGTTLHAAFGVVPATVDQPELVVAEGSLRAMDLGLQPAPTGDWPAAAPLPVTWTPATWMPAWMPATLIPTTLMPASWPARRRRTALVAAVAAGVAALVLLSVAIATRGEPGRTQRPPGALSAPPAAQSGSVQSGSTQSGSTQSGSNPGASSSPATPGVDRCLIGTWISTSNTVYGLIDSTRVLYSGAAGIVVTYRADGTGLTDYSAMQPRTARYRGSTWSDVIRGTTTFTYFVQDSSITSTTVASTAVGTLRRDGRVNATQPVQYYPEPARYLCRDNALKQYSDQGNYQIDYVRLVASEPPPSPQRQAV